MRIKSKLSMVVVAISAIIMIATIGGYAYWSVQKTLTGNQIASGQMVIEVTNAADGSIGTSLNVAGLMPGQSGSKAYIVQSAADNPNTDLFFSVDNVMSTKTLADNVNVAILLETTGLQAYFLTPTGTIEYDFTGTIKGTPEQQIAAASFPMSAYSGESWSNLPGYTNLPALSSKHITVYYSLPLDCDANCHSDTVTFDMTFGLSQYHP